MDKKEQRDMAITKAQKAATIAAYGKNDKDTGKTDVQIALLTERINSLTDHFKAHKKDTNSRRGLLMLVGQRRRLLKYLQRTDLEGYRGLIGKLGLRK
jgi:small subunit ribosomal protein S15